VQERSWEVVQREQGSKQPILTFWLMQLVARVKKNARNKGKGKRKLQVAVDSRYPWVRKK